MCNTEYYYNYYYYNHAVAVLRDLRAAAEYLPDCDINGQSGDDVGCAGDGAWRFVTVTSVCGEAVRCITVVSSGDDGDEQCVAEDQVVGSASIAMGFAERKP